MSENNARKLQTSIAFTARQTNAINVEARRLGISFGDVIRRWIDDRIDKDGDSRASKLYSAKA